jgi:hypothetical protein
MNGERWLFKEGRPGTGENWAEKAACEIARLIGLPCAHYDLAIWRDKLGTVSKYFLPERSILVHGNELLFLRDTDYPVSREHKRGFQKVRQHTLIRVLGAQIERIEVTVDDYPELRSISAFKAFVGYFVFDALIGNTDRHHENWGVIYQAPQKESPRLILAPTFDHASSLGRELNDPERIARLQTTDAGFAVSAYADRARSAIFDNEEDRTPLTCFDVVVRCQEIHREAVSFWLDRLSRLDDAVWPDQIHNRIPISFVSQPARDFASRLLVHNKNRLLTLL